MSLTTHEQVVEVAWVQMESVNGAQWLLASLPLSHRREVTAFVRVGCEGCPGVLIPPSLEMKSAVDQIHVHRKKRIQVIGSHEFRLEGQLCCHDCPEWK